MTYYQTDTPFSNVHAQSDDYRRFALAEVDRILVDFHATLRKENALKPALQQAMYFVNVSATLTGLDTFAPFGADFEQKLHELDREVAGSGPAEAVAQRVVHVLEPLLRHSAKCLAHVELAFALPAIRMTLYRGVLNFIAFEPDLHRATLSMHLWALKKNIADKDPHEAVEQSKNIVDDIVWGTCSDEDKPLYLRPEMFAACSMDDEAKSNGVRSLLHEAE